MKVTMKTKDRMIKLAQDFYTELGYPISTNAEYEFKENTLFIFEPLKVGMRLTRAVFETEDDFEIVDMRGQTRILLQQPKDYLSY